MSKFESFSKEKRFEDLSKAVQHCNICSRLSCRTKVLTRSNGNIDTRVLFVAEAPGRLGADRTGIPLHGDRTGDFFESLIGNIGWTREQFFITNAILCNPRDEKGNNGTPTKEEIFNCNLYLDMVIELIQPQVIVPLGKTALDSLSLICPHNLTLREKVGKLNPWYGRYLFPLYHPGPRALLHRSIAKQRSDYMLLAKHVDLQTGVKLQKKSKLAAYPDLAKIINLPLCEMISIFLRQFGEVSLFKLTKLLYLTDLMALKQLGSTLSGEIYLRRQEGPWLPNLTKTMNAIKGDKILVTRKRESPYISLGPSGNVKITLNEEALSVIINVIERYGKMNDAQIKTATYLTEPMKYILRQEKLGRDMRKVPVIYKDKNAIDLDASAKC